MEDKKSNKGGVRAGAGRPSKMDEAKKNVIFNTAVKDFFKKKDDDTGQIELVKSLLESDRGKIWVSEHIFGKPKEKIDITTDGESLNSDVDYSKLSTDVLKRLEKELNENKSNQSTE